MTRTLAARSGAGAPAGAASADVPFSRRSLTRFAWLSIGAALATIVLKSVAWWLTGSVGLLSDAAESLVNLFGAVVALIVLRMAVRPPDEDHLYGHAKAEYFAGAIEGGLILLAAVTIAASAVTRLLNPRPLDQPGEGLLVSSVATIINLVVARILLRNGRIHNSITLEADGQHLMTDVWTSVGVIAGVGAVALTGWQRLDPIIALLVAANIVWTAFHLLRRSAMGLMDTALPLQEQDRLQVVLDRYKKQGVEFHALRTRQAGARRFMSMHVLVPGFWTVQHGHELLEEIEAEIRAALPEVTIVTHLEPIEDPTSFDDTGLDR